MNKEKALKQLDSLYEKLHDVNSHYRGKIISNAINTETHLEMIISHYFTDGNNQKAKELRHCLLSHNMFSSNNKKNMFLFIAKTHFPKCKVSSTDLERIMNLRNQMAHGKLVFSSDKLIAELVNFDNNTITLHEWKTKNNEIISNKIILTKEFVEKEIKHIVSINSKLIGIIDAIKKSQNK